MTEYVEIYIARVRVQNFWLLIKFLLVCVHELCVDTGHISAFQIQTACLDMQFPSD